MAVLPIHDIILVWIRIRGSIPVTNGSVADPLHYSGVDPDLDPRIHASRLMDPDAMPDPCCFRH